jgi:hypothetical protein
LNAPVLPPLLRENANFRRSFVAAPPKVRRLSTNGG